MYRLIITIWFILFAFHWLGAQDKLDFNTVNNETYRLYLAQEWDSLIVTGTKALHGDIDYYYLRMRLGIACYNKKKYRKAAGHFTHALSFNQDDPVALEYLYFSRLLSGKQDQAEHVRKRFKGDLALKLPPPKARFLDQLSLEYTFNKGVNDEFFENLQEVYPLTAAGVQYTTRHFSNFSLSLVNSIAPGISLIHTYNYLVKSNHYFYSDGTTSFHMPNQHVFQHQYYFSPRFTTSSGFIFTPMFHILRIRHETAEDTGQGYMGGSSQWTNSYLYETDFATGMSFQKGIGSIDLDLGGWYSKINGADQIQNRLGITWFPLGNLNLYAGGYMNSQVEISPGEEHVFRYIPELLFGFAISEKVWFDLKTAIGEMANYLENNGSIVYNSFSEMIDKKIQFMITVPVTDKGSLLYFGGKWTSNRSEFFPFEPALANDISNTIQYNAYSIFGGLSWKF